MPGLRIKFAIYIALAVIVGGLFGWFLNDRTITRSGSSDQLRADVGVYKFVNPLLLSSADNSKSAAFGELANLIRQNINSITARGDAISASVYLRELNTGRWTGINEDDMYRPSSMLKVLTIMAALKIAEEDPSILERRIRYTPDDSSKRYMPGGGLREGNHKVTDLIYNTIVYSDNASNDALLSDKEINNAFNFVYSLFRLPRNDPAGADFMSAKSYSSVFRVLYNSTLFQWKLSEQVLDLLSKTDFKKGIVAGVPENITVAHKFGEAAIEQKGGKVLYELHDCGIVYYQKSPYFLCVMTKGLDEDKLSPVVAEISRIVWKFMNEKEFAS